jgi:hypothetical protein
MAFRIFGFAGGGAVSLTFLAKRGSPYFSSFLFLSVAMSWDGRCVLSAAAVFFFLLLSSLFRERIARGRGWRGYLVRGSKAGKSPQKSEFRLLRDGRWDEMQD